MDNDGVRAAYRVARALRGWKRPTTTTTRMRKEEEEGHSWWGGDGDGDGDGGGDGGAAWRPAHRLGVATSGVLVLAALLVRRRVQRRAAAQARDEDVRVRHGARGPGRGVGALDGWGILTDGESNSARREGPARFEMRELEPGDPRWRDVAAADGKYSDDAFVTPDGRKLCVLRVLGCEETEGLTKRLTKRLAGEAGEAS